MCPAMKRDYILQEIKPTARANDGKPLGHQKFSAETGIKYTALPDICFDRAMVGKPLRSRGRVGHGNRQGERHPALL
jgi:hypothetical protein